MALKKACTAAILHASFITLLSGCVNGAGEPDLDSMIHPDLSQVSDPLLLEALNEARRVISASPDSAAAWAHLGHLYLIHGWKEEAVPCYERAAKIAPDEFRWLYFLGKALHKRDPLKSAELLARAQALDAKYPPAFIYRAYALRNLGRFDEATKQFEQALAVEPRSYFALLGLGQQALASGRFKEAEAFLHQAMRINPKREEVHAALAQVAMGLGEEDKARRHSQEARRHITTEAIPDPLWGEVEQVGTTAY